MTKQVCKHKPAVTRRGFVAGSTQIAGAALAAGALGTAAVPSAQAEEAPAQKAAAPAYEVVNSDIVVVGAGFGAFNAAFEAVSKGRRVTVIEKGTFLHGGNCGYNWDVIAGWLPDLSMMSMDLYSGNIVNQETNYNGMVYDAGSVERQVEWVNKGQTLLDRNEDGSLYWYSDYPMLKSVQGVFPRLTLDELAKSPLVTIVERTMVTNLLINDGRCLGAVGVYLPTGDYRVYRAPVTIVATGPTNWFYGWTGVSAYTNGSADNTGDVDMALYRRGVGIGDSEHACYDFLTTYPKGLAFGFNTALNPDANEYRLFCDKDGNPLVTEENGWDIERAAAGDRTYFNTQCARSIAAGLGTEDGGLMCGAIYDHLRTTMKQNLPVFESFGVDPLNELIPIHDEIYERGGSPVVDEKMRVEGIEGLFCVRGASAMTGTNGGATNIKLMRMGRYALACALEYLESAEPVDEVDWSDAEAEFARLDEIKDREVEGGLRPHEVRHAIQVACGTCMGVYRDSAKLEACYAELKRIETEDMPRMVVSNKTKTFNNEWKDAIENYNLLDAALLAVGATLERPETRGCYLRPEYPEANEDWACMLVGTKVDGAIEFSKRFLPNHEW